MERWTLPEGWEYKSFAEICRINPKRPRLERGDEVPTSFLPMRAVDEQVGVIVDMQIRPYGEVKRGYTYFEENDVLMAKITPSMENGKAAIARNLIDGIGFGTTEFHVFHPNSYVLPEWIFYFVRRKTFREKAKMNFRGAVGQQRVPEDFLVNQEIPIPYPYDPARSLAEQRRIVARLEALLDEVREMRKLQAAIETDVGRLMEAALGEVFPSQEQALPKGWEWVKIGDLVTVNYGDGLPRRARLGGSVPVYGANGIVGYHNVAITRGQTIIIGRKGSAGAVNWSDVPCWPIDTTFFVDEFPESIFPKFLYYFLQNRELEKLQQSAAIPGLNRDILRNVSIPLPYPSDPERSLAEQRRIVAYLDAVQAEVNAARRLAAHDRQALAQLEQSILAAAFRGEMQG